jgi:hypothetical protein
VDQGPRSIVGTMETASHTVSRIQTRNAAMRMLNRLTAGVAFTAVAGVGLLGAVSAHTIPGTPTSSTTSASVGTGSTSAGVQSSSTSVSQSSSSAVAVSGGS